MKKLIAIGGGEIEKPGYPSETTKIDKEIIRLTGKKNPKLLFIPTASLDSEKYYDVIKKHFGKKLGCKTDVLCLIKDNFSRKEAEDKILNSDIIYVGGGNTLKMLKVWKKIGIDKVLKKAHKKGIVISGLSAGSICWFKYGNSDSRKITNPNTSYIKITGLGLINAFNCPHYNSEEDRKEDLKRMMKKSSSIAIALDDCCAIEIIDNKYKIVTSKKNANAYKVYWKKNKYFEEIIKKENCLKQLKTLLTK